MTSSRIFPLVFLLCSALLLGQQATKQHGDSASLTLVRSAGNSCPIGVEVSIVGMPPVSIAASSTNGHKVPPPAKYIQLHLDVSNPSSRDIVGARFTAHGFSRKLRSFDLSDSTNAPDLERAVEVPLDVQGNGHASIDVSLTYFTAVVTSIDLDSVVYADGAPWQAPAAGACNIIPNAAMRIASAL